MKLTVCSVSDQIIEVELFTCHGQNIAEVLADNGYAYYKGRRRKETTEGYDEKPEGDDEKPEGDDEEASSKYVHFWRFCYCVKILVAIVKEF